jgi:cytochrome c
MGGDFHKVWGSVLVALTVAFAIGIVINEATHAEHHEANAYKIDVPEGGSQVAAVPQAPVLEPVGPLLASADASAGERAFRRCGSCHTVEKGGPNKIGPNLYNIVGSAKGAASGFAYSDAIKAMGGEWTYADLNAFLAKPKDFLAGTKMNFNGISNVKDRANVIAYLRANADTPPPLPAQ